MDTPSGPTAPNTQPGPNSLFARAFSELLVLEGVDSNDPDDPGGQTRYGITAAEWMTRHAGHPPKPLIKITIYDAQKFYEAFYWQEPGLDRLAAVAPLVAWECFEAGVNCGPGTAVKFLQRALNFLAATGLTEDGGLGAKTLGAVGQFLSRGREYQSLLVLAQNGEQYLHYKGCVERRETSRRFAPGWMKRVEDDHA